VDKSAPPCWSLTLKAIRLNGYLYSQLIKAFIVVSSTFYFLARHMRCEGF